MPETTRADAVRRVGAGVVALLAVWTAATLLGNGTGALLGDGPRAMLGEGPQSAVGDLLRALRADGLPALTLVLGSVPAVALVLVAALRPPGPSSRATRIVVGVVVAGVVLFGYAVLVMTADPTALSLATRYWSWAVGSPRVLAGAWLALVGAGSSVAAAGVLGRRRGAVVSGAALVSVGALATALSAGAWIAWTVLSAGRYRGGPTVAAVLLGDGALALALVAATAAVVSGWCAVAAWRFLAHWVAPPSEAQVRRRRLVGWATAGALVVALGTTVGVRVAQRQTASDVVVDPVLAACVEHTALAPARLDEVYTVDCPWDGSGEQVRSLAGIEKLTSVREIDLTGQDVSDLGPLAAMPGLTSLRLTGNDAVADLSPLGGLPLANLGLSDTGVTDLGPLARTTTLQWVGLADTGVSDLGPLATSVGLLELDVAHAAVADLSPLAGAGSLSMLDVRDNQVADVAPIAAMSALDELWVGGNPVTDLRPLLDAPALLGVDVEGIDGQTPGIEELRAQGVYVGGLA
ncbi:hypothetical protein [Cellulomonas sp.]|uniref:hypothetical protein n=1 Tax=Cellulomonas sp. TaxID=40001 RepID=UPI003BA8E4F3